MVKQKDAVIAEVMNLLPNFVKNQDNALKLLSESQLELIKENIKLGILNSTIEYSKDISNTSEVKTYARSMVMNHLKKAKELNGGQTYSKGSPSLSNGSSSTTNSKSLKGVDLNLLPADLRAHAEKL